MHKSTAVWILGIISVLGTYLYFPHRLREEVVVRPKVVNPAAKTFVLPCWNGGEERDLNFSGSVRVNQLFLPASAKPLSESEAKVLVQEQFKFFFGLFTENQKYQQTGRLFPSSSPAEIKIGDIAKVAYGKSLIVDRPFEFGASDYVNRALARGFTQADDPGLKIQYTAKVRVGTCLKDSALKTVDLLLPYDPYLAYWLVPKTERRLRAWGAEKSVTTPCGSSEMAHLRLPFEYWIDWDPEAQGQDANNKSFDCSRLLTPQKDFGVFQASVGSPLKGPAFVLGEPLKNGSGPLRIGLIQSPLEPWTRKLDTKNLLAQLTQVKGSLDQSAAATYRAAIMAAGSQDPGFVGFAYFLAQLPQIINIQETKISRTDTNLIFHISGKLKLSSRPLEFNIYYGDTDVAGTQPQHHWPFLLKSLAKDDIILYLGHSGMGTNLSLSRMRSDMKMNLKQARSIASKKPYQLIGALSCNAYSYFPEGFRELRPASTGALKTDLLMLANSSYRPLFFLGLLRHVDRLIRGDQPGLYDSFGSYLGRDDIIVFERVARD